MEDLIELFHELGKGGRGEGEYKSEKSYSSDQLPFSIHGCLIIQWGWVSEAKEDDEDEQEEPSRIVKDGDEGHDSDGDEKNSSTPSPKEGIGNVASV
jgi:hypothetical protein